MGDRNDHTVEQRYVVDAYHCGNRTEFDPDTDRPGFAFQAGFTGTGTKLPISGRSVTAVFRATGGDKTCLLIRRRSHWWEPRSENCRRLVHEVLSWPPTENIDLSFYKNFSPSWLKESFR
jgi:hypothetical protein